MGGDIAVSKGSEQNASIRSAADAYPNLSLPKPETSSDRVLPISGTASRQEQVSSTRPGEVSEVEGAKFKEFYNKHKAAFLEINKINGELHPPKDKPRLGDRESLERVERLHDLKKDIKVDLVKLLEIPADMVSSMRADTFSSTFIKADGVEVPTIQMKVRSDQSIVHSTMAFSLDGDLLFSTTKDFKRNNEGIMSLRKVVGDHLSDFESTLRASTTVDDKNKCQESVRKAFEEKFSDLLKEGERLEVTIWGDVKQESVQLVAVSVQAVSKSVGLRGEMKNSVPLARCNFERSGGKVVLIEMELKEHERVIPKEAKDSLYYVPHPTDRYRE